MAYDATPYQETEDRAWLLTQMAHLHLLAGRLDRAEDYAAGALALFPNYHYALGTLAQVRLSQKRYSDAVTLLQKRYAAAPHAENLFDLADALEKAGRKAEAAKAFADFARQAVQESSSADNANHELIAYYAGYANKPTDAIRIAKQELARRHDVHTLASYAWALASSGDYARADAEMRKAVSVGVKDPVILQHAAFISQRLAQ
jgi:tetratricopeptide (TPR) repeat protein